MGQYHLPVNLDKKEFIRPHRLGSGLKLWEQLANEGVGRAMIILLAHPAQRGGGDLDVDANWHGPERKDFTKVGKMPEEYPAIAKRTIGRWRGDRIAVIGDYAEDKDFKTKKGDPKISAIYSLCRETDGDEPIKGAFTDVTDDVCAVIEHELNGRFIGDGWRNFLQKGGKVSKWVERDRIEGEILDLNEKLVAVKWPNGVKRYHGAEPKVDFF